MTSPTRPTRRYSPQTPSGVWSVGKGPGSPEEKARRPPPVGDWVKNAGKSALCSRCRLWFLASQCRLGLPEDPTRDWQGEVYQVCWQCHMERTGGACDPHLYDSRQWEKECTQERLRRKIRAGEHLGQRVRNVKYDLAKADIEARHPGESRKTFRMRLRRATVCVGTQVAIAYITATTENKVKLFQHVITWCDEMTKQAQDPKYVPVLAEVAISDLEHQFLSEIVYGA